jgi:hypothetical protein
VLDVHSTPTGPPFGGCSGLLGRRTTESSIGFEGFDEAFDSRGVFIVNLLPSTCPTASGRLMLQKVDDFVYLGIACLVAAHAVDEIEKPHTPGQDLSCQECHPPPEFGFSSHGCEAIASA